jgi:hypothetical protein
MSMSLFGGSRVCQSQALVSRVVGAWLASGGSVSTGCATGADALVVSSCLAWSSLAGSGGAGQLSVFAAFGPGGRGSWFRSSVAGVQAAAAAGAQVSWCAGGELGLPLSVRLFRRSWAALCGCNSAVFFEPGPGSLSVATAAVGRGLPVFVFSTSAPACLRGCGGCWVPGVFAGLGCWRWSSGQLPLF